MFVFAEAMIAPQVEIVDITPTSLRAEWTAINTEVDSWVASIQSDLTDTINGDQEDNTLFKVTGPVVLKL